MPENINEILGKLAETLKLTRQCSDIVSISKIDEWAVICYENGRTDRVNIDGDSGIAAVYDIVRKLKN